MNHSTSRWAIVAAFTAILSTGFAGCKQTTSASAGNNAADKTSAAAVNASKPNEPDVNFEKLQGGDLPLASLKGKVVLVNFWATWCEPCQIEIPWMIGFQNKYANQGFTILGVAMDTDGRKVVDPFVQKTKYDVDGTQSLMTYPIMIGNLDIAEKFGGLLGYPSSFLISRDGKVVKRFIGLVDHDKLQTEIEKQIALH